MRQHSKHRWFVVAVFFFFMLLHQSDKLLIGSLTTKIMETFQITMTQMGLVSTGALVVGALWRGAGADHRGLHCRSLVARGCDPVDLPFHLARLRDFLRRCGAAGAGGHRDLARPDA